MKTSQMEYTLRQENQEISSDIYEGEREILELVRNGDVERVKEKIDTAFSSCPQVIAFSDKKNEEYRAVTAISLVCRAAIEGGVPSEESFALSGTQLQEIAAAREIEDILEIRNDAVIAFGERVAAGKGRKRSSLYVAECKSYIASHIFQKILVGDIAKELALNSVYLERIFKRSEGTTIGRYIQREKIRRAKTLLIYSDRPIREISDCLSFSSQSHFGKVFRQETGMTPKQYRQANHKRNL